MQEQKHWISRRTFLGGAAAFAAVSVSVLSPLSAFAAPTAAEKQAEADQVRVQVDALRAELVDKTNAYGAALDDHDAAVAAMDKAQSDIDDTNAKIADIQSKLSTRVRSMYRSGSSTFLDIIFASTSFTDFATTWDLLNKMNNDDATMVEQAKALKQQLEDAKDEYAKQEKIAADKLEEAKNAKDEVQQAADQYQALLDSLDAEVVQLILQEQQAAAEAAAAAAIAQQQQNNNNGSSGSSSGGTGYTADDFGPPAGDILSEAIKYVGVVPYVWGGSDPSVGFDCSGLVWYCCMRTGHNIPPRTTYGYGGGWFPVSQAQPGDILWQYEHVGICAAPGGTSYVHAANEQYGICWGSSPQFTRAYRF